MTQSLQAKLDAYKVNFKKQAPESAQRIMERSTEDLRNSGILEETIKVGQSLPRFTLNNQDGTQVDSTDLLQQGPLVITVFRGVWCPYCNIELESLNEVLPEITSQGANFVAIAPQLEKSAQKNKRSKHLDFDILIDKANSYSEQLGLVFSLPEDLREIYSSFGIVLPDHNGDDSWTLPMPARLVVDQDGTIVYADINPDYTERPEPADVIAVLKELNSQRAVA